MDFGDDDDVDEVEVGATVAATVADVALNTTITSNSPNLENTTSEPSQPSPPPPLATTNEVEDPDQARALKEAEANRELEVSAKLELEEWYSRYASQISLTKETNRLRQPTGADADPEAPPNWSEVVEMCNIKATKNVRDVTRLRSILLHLKEQDVSS